MSKAYVTLWEVDEDGARNHVGLIAARQKVNSDGSFEIRFLAPGHYNVTAADGQAGPTTRYVGEYGNIALAEQQVLSSVVVQLHSEPLRMVRVRVIAPPELHDRVVVLLRDTNFDDSRRAPFGYSQTAEIDDRNVASFDSVPCAHYNVYAMLTGDDLSTPSWTHDEVHVELNGNHAEAVVRLRKVGVSDHQP